MESFVDAFPCAGMVFVNTGGALNMDLTEVAFFLGFAGLSTFSRSFKRWTGKSPNQYRKAA
jgi:AraC-like DNA-binding protein